VLPAIQNLVKIANSKYSTLLSIDLIDPALLIAPAKNQKNSEKFARQQEFAVKAFGDRYDEIKQMIDENKLLQLTGKLQVLKTLLAVWKAKDAKVLLFSQSTKNMDYLEVFLKNEKYTYNRLDGSTPNSSRQKLVDNFNLNKNKFIFLISTKAGGLGLNCQSANVVIVFDPNWVSSSL
jgi:SWI/SNF-related matrix-associated actin-dependent regulator 1 of chromatin subfamily A